MARIKLDIPYKAGSRPDEVWICCPVCITRRGRADEDFKMGVNLRNGRFGCFKCKAGNSNTNLKILENLDLYRDDSVDLDRLLAAIHSIGVRNVQEAVDLDEISDPLTEDETPFAYNYMTQVRGFTDDDIKRLNLRVGKPYWTTGKDGTDYESKRWQGRVIFPFMEQGKPMFLVGRTYVGKDPKYLNSTDRKKDAFVYGIDNVTDGVAILCEGIISAWAAEKYTGVPAVSILGYYATPTQLMKLRTRVHTLYLCLDGGVDQEVVKRLLKQLDDFGFGNVYKIQLPGKADPDELKEKFTEYFREAERLSLF
jgi:hypothetical protein